MVHTSTSCSRVTHIAHTASDHRGKRSQRHTHRTRDSELHAVQRHAQLVQRQIALTRQARATQTQTAHPGDITQATKRAPHSCKLVQRHAHHTRATSASCTEWDRTSLLRCVATPSPSWDALRSLLTRAALDAALQPCHANTTTTSASVRRVQQRTQRPRAERLCGNQPQPQTP